MTTPAAGAPAYHRSAAPHAMRVVLGGGGLLYFWSAGKTTGFLPLSHGAVLGLIALYALLNAAASSRHLRAGMVRTVALDLAILLVIVLEDPYPAAPVTVLLLSTIFEYGRRLAPAAFGAATAAALCILLLNVAVRLISHRFPLPPEGAWLSGAIGVLLVNLYVVARAAARVRGERRAMAQQLEELSRREAESVQLRLRMAQLGECLQFTGQSSAEFADRALGGFVRELGAVAGAVYELVREPAGAALVPLATYAADRSRLEGRRIALDEGPVGACAARAATIEFDQVPEGYFRLESGLGGGNPPCLLLVPLKMQTRLAGVMELALSSPPGGGDREVLERMSPLFAAGLLAAR